MTERASVDDWHYPAPPKLGGSVKVSDWLLAVAEIDERKGATARAREAREIAQWLKLLSRWLKWQLFEPSAQAIEAAAAAETRSGSVHESAVGEADAPEPPPNSPPKEPTQ